MRLGRRTTRHLTQGVAGLAAAALLLACTALVGATGPAAAAAARGAPAGLRMVAARPAVPYGARAVGAVSGSTTIHADVALRPSDPKGLRAYADAVGDPSSPLYHHYLSSTAALASFGPHRSAVAAVERMLRIDGLRVTQSRGSLVSFAGTVRSIDAAFGTTIESYRLVGGRTVHQPASALKMPAAIARYVEGVVGLGNTLLPHDNALHFANHRPTGERAARAPVAASKASPGGPSACAAAKKAAAVYGGLTDDQLTYAYGVDPLYANGDAGRGQTVGAFELQGFSRSDVETFDTCYFGKAKAGEMLSRLRIRNVDGGDQYGNGDEAELDIDDLEAVAPAADVEVYEAPPTYQGLLDEWNAIVQDDNAKVITSSWYSDCEAYDQFLVPGFLPIENTLFEQAATQGQTILESSGDAGEDGCAGHASNPVSPVLSAQAEEANPYVLSVGGTTIDDATNPPVERVWNDGNDGGAGGGGLSNVWPSPSWEAHSLVPGVDNSKVLNQAEADLEEFGESPCGAKLCNEMPDVSAQADEFTGAVTVYEAPFGGWTTFGGTSSSTPLWAAMLADINSTKACENEGGVGFVNPKLFAIASSAAEYKASFNDITAGNNDLYGVTGGLFPATRGFDMGSGLGSPLVTGRDGRHGLAYYLCAPPSSLATAHVTSVSPRAVPEAGGHVVIRGTAFESAGKSDVAALQVGTYTLPAAAYTVKSPTVIDATLPASSAETGAGNSGDGTGTYAVVVTLRDGMTSAPSTASRVVYYATTSSHEVPEVEGVGVTGSSKAGGLTVNVFGSGFSGSGTPKVTFGGVPGSNVKVMNDNVLTVVVPAYEAGTTACVTNTNPTTDVCQTQVRVKTSKGISATSPIEKPFTGPSDDEGAPGTGELYPAATEFDYYPRPHISSITVDTGEASPAGTSTATIKGIGFDYNAEEWYNVGPYQQASSQGYDVLYWSPTQLVVGLPPEPPSTNSTQVPVTIQSFASPNVGNTGPTYVETPPSNAVAVTYAATPEVSGVQAVSDSGHVLKYDAGPARGGTHLVIHGLGFAGAGVVLFTDVGAAGSTYGFGDAEQYDISVTGNEVKLTTPGANPSIDAVSVCNAFVCSPFPASVPAPGASGDVFTYYAPGFPVVGGVSPSKGKAGTTVTISGNCLGFATAVYFGSKRASSFANAPALLDEGSTTTVYAVAPAGLHGTVNVRIETLQSMATGYGKSHNNKEARFTYEP